MPNSDPNRVMSPLNMIVKLKPGLAPALKQAGPKIGEMIRKGADAIGTLHDARFIQLDESTVMLLTTYDGDFDTYVFDFTKHLSEVFNVLLLNAENPPPLPVEKNPQAFADWVRERDLPVLGSYYSAYPNLSVQDIHALATAKV